MHFLTSEVGPGIGETIGARHPDLGDLLPTEQWAVLSGDPVPAELVAYEDRLRTAVPTAGVAETRGGYCDEGAFAADQAHEPVTTNRSGSCSSTWFQDTQCFIGAGDFNWCLLNHWNGAWVAYSDVATHRTAACGDIGNVTLRVQLDGTTAFQHTVLEGEYRYYSYSNCGSIFCNDPDYRADVLNASGDRFHFSAWGYF